MSRRKDKERFLANCRQNPDYKGFRGYANDPSRSGNTPLVAVNCSVCGKKRNVPVGVAEEQGDGYVCMTCQDEQTAVEATGPSSQAP
ncbi:MAG: hypothetical protein OXC99_05335 [Chloroflexi bacterium]|nr:hypothetical protein [Chloroflexota bacterium]